MPEDTADLKRGVTEASERIGTGIKEDHHVVRLPVENRKNFETAQGIVAIAQHGVKRQRKNILRSSSRHRVNRALILSRFILELRRIQTRISAVMGQQFVVRAALRDAPLFQY